MTNIEKRKMKYPDTDVFTYYNANPKNKITEDCVYRAVCTALDIPYEQVVMEMAEQHCKTGFCSLGNQGIDHYMKSKGWVRVKQPRKENNTKYTGAEFCRKLQHPIYIEELGFPDFYIDRLLCNIGGHHTVAIVGGTIQDTWNSSNGTIGQVWVKPA